LNSVLCTVFSVLGAVNSVLCTVDIGLCTVFSFNRLLIFAVDSLLHLQKNYAALIYLFVSSEGNVEITACSCVLWKVIILPLSTDGGQGETEHQINFRAYRCSFVNWNLQRALLSLNIELQDEEQGKDHLTYCVALMVVWSMIDSLSEWVNVCVFFYSLTGSYGYTYIGLNSIKWTLHW